jgi:hypothetical protein
MYHDGANEARDGASITVIGGVGSQAALAGVGSQVVLEGIGGAWLRLKRWGMASALLRHGIGIETLEDIGFTLPARLDLAP